MWSILVLVLLSLIQLCVGGRYCSDTYCPNECCGSSRQYCCDDYVSDISAGIIVTIVMCIVVGIGAVIAIVCCCIRRRGFSGQVMTRQQAPGMIVASQTVYNQSGYVAQPGIVSPHSTTYPQTQPMQPPSYAHANMGFQAGGPSDLSVPPPAYTAAFPDTSALVGPDSQMKY